MVSVSCIVVDCELLGSVQDAGYSFTIMLLQCECPLTVPRSVPLRAGLPNANHDCSQER